MCTSISVFLVVLLCMLSGTTSNQPFTAEMIAHSLMSLSNKAFGWSMYELLSTQEGNVVFSPLSAQTVMTILWLGSNGNTSKQLEQVVHILPESQYFMTFGFNSLLRDLKSTKTVNVELAYKLYLQEGTQINCTFQQAISEAFQSALEKVDFANDTEIARTSINQWVESTTHGKIRELIARGSLNPHDKLVAVNALYFKGGWVKPFLEEETATKSFHVSTARTVDTPMMNQVNHYWYARNIFAGFRVIKLPYRVRDPDQQGGEFAGDQSMSMVILLPDAIDGLSRLESLVVSGNLTTKQASMAGAKLVYLLRDMEYRHVNVTIPRFKIEKTMSLGDKLKQLGITLLFQEGSDLPGFSNENLFVSEVFQKACLEVTEKGTDAASTIYEEVTPMAASQIEEFNADHPFLFVIMDEDRELILLIGRVVEPN